MNGAPDPPKHDSPSVEAVRELERRLAERTERRAAAEAALQGAREEGERIRAAAAARGVEAAAARRRELLAEAETEAARIRADGEERVARLVSALSARLERTVVELEELVLPGGEG